MITIQSNSVISSMHWSSEIEEQSLEKTKVTQVAHPTINRSTDRRKINKSEEIFWVKIRIKLLFRLLKNGFSKTKAKILLILFIIKLLMSGVPIEALQDIINELLEEFKEDQKLFNQLETLFPLILGQDEQRQSFEDSFQVKV